MISKYFKVYKNDKLLNLAIDKYGFHPLLYGFLGFTFYYIIPLLLNIFQGTAFNDKVLLKISDTPILCLFSPLFNLMPNKNILKPVFTDAPHLIAGIVVGVILCLWGSYLLFNTYKLQIYLMRNKLYEIESDVSRKIILKLNKTFDNIYIRIVALFMGLVIFINFILVALSDNNLEWWGNIKYGYSGIYLGLVCGFITYYTFYAAVACIFSIPTYFLLFKKLKLNIYPYWPDGSNGLRPLGNFIIQIALASMSLSIVLFSVLKFGYVGIENSTFFWSIIIMYILILPLFLLLPLIPIVKNTRKAKFKELKIISSEINKYYYKLKKILSDNGLDKNYSKSLSKISELEKHFELVNSISVWPFNIRLMQTWFISYLLQIVILILQYWGNGSRQ